MQLHSLLLATLWLITATANAESYEVLGRTLKLTQPHNFCKLGNTAGELEFMEFKTKTLAPAGVLTQLTVPCNEIDEFRRGTIDNFSRWASVLVLRRNGQLGLVLETRDEFVRGTAGKFSTNKVNFEEVNRRVREHLSPSGSSVAVTGARPIGVQDSAFFTTIEMQTEARGQKVPIVAVVAVTVVNRLPIAIQVYATPGESGSPIGEVALSYVQRVIAEN